MVMMTNWIHRQPLIQSDSRFGADPPGRITVLGENRAPKQFVLPKNLPRFYLPAERV